MKILLVHNRRLTPTGEDSVVASMERILSDRGNSVEMWIKDNSELRHGIVPRVRAVFSGIHSPRSVREMTKRLIRFTPDCVHVHNIYPLFSPSILAACVQRRVAVFFHCHNFQFTCPTTFAYRNHQICMKCSGGNEGWCLVHNCQGTRLGSAAYALRSTIARRLDRFRNVTAIIVPSQFLRQQLHTEGIEAGRIYVLPNPVDIPRQAAVPGQGEYVGYIGRISSEKGIEDFLETARMLPQIPFRVAGVGPDESTLRRLSSPNVTWMGFVTGPDRDLFYRQARMIVVPSRWHEPFGLAAAEPMAFGIPVIATQQGGLPEVVQDNVTGRLVSPNNPRDLARTIEQLWPDVNQIEKFGSMGRHRAQSEFSHDIFYERLCAIYRTGGRNKIPAEAT
jgi:glycosyltransferase involved in cell wall biosynthesis